MAETKSKTVKVPSWLLKLQTKWGLDSLVQVVAVLAVFTLTGSTVVYIRRFLFDIIGFDEATPTWLKIITYLVCVMPMYQILLLAYGFLLGQFSFFWEKEKKLFRRIKSLF